MYQRAKSLNGNTGVNFIQLLECRLDSVLFRMRFANTFEEIHQMISHKHILVNNSIVNSKSFTLKPGDVISVSKQSFDYIYNRVLYNKMQYLNVTDTQKTESESVESIQNKHKLFFTPDYLEIDYSTLRGIFVELPLLSQVMYPYSIDLSKIIEYYEYKRKI
jgi:small subunit ribosomal protein S4